MVTPPFGFVPLHLCTFPLPSVLRPQSLVLSPPASVLRHPTTDLRPPSHLPTFTHLYLHTSSTAHRVSRSGFLPSVLRLPSSVIRHPSLSPICYLLSPTTPPSDQLAYLILVLTMHLHLQSLDEVQSSHREPYSDHWPPTPDYRLPPSVIRPPSPLL